MEDQHTPEHASSGMSGPVKHSVLDSSASRQMRSATSGPTAAPKPSVASPVHPACRSFQIVAAPGLGLPPTTQTLRPYLWSRRSYASSIERLWHFCRAGQLRRGIAQGMTSLNPRWGANHPLSSLTRYSPSCTSRFRIPHLRLASDSDPGEVFTRMIRAIACVIAGRWVMLKV